ncbi:MAG: methyltransferase protein [Solirubrobacterales bacterium]|nr:methyltransferase protein [Solirubrobacterales bacterium]
MPAENLTCCPRCHGALADDAQDSPRCTACGASYGTLGGIPVLVADADLDAIDLRETGGHLPTYDCAGLGIPSVDAALARGDRILELGAGLDTHRAPNVVMTDAFVYGADHLDVVADAHALPFADASFDFVFSLAVFEHLHSPWIAAREIARVLRPGGSCYTLAAFLQPLHGYPDHYFNATESGLRRLFEDDFEVQEAGPSRCCPHRESLVPGLRMREMARELRDDATAPWRTRWRARRLDRALMTAGHQFLQLADEMTRRPVGHESWRQIAPAVEVVAVRRDGS